MEETISKESQSPGYLVSEFTGVRSKKSQTISIKQYLDKVRSDEFKEKVLRHRLLRQQPGHEAPFYYAGQLESFLNDKVE